MGFFQSTNLTNLFGRMAMFFDEETIYSKRYPSAEEEFEMYSADTTLPVITPEQREASYTRFLEQMNTEPQAEPIPGQEEKTRKCIDLAKEFSEEYEVDIDIIRSPYSVNINLHFYCAAYSKRMTSQFVQLLNMCDSLSSVILETEPSDFTLTLTMNTHKFYPPDTMLNDF